VLSDSSALTATEVEITSGDTEDDTMDVRDPVVVQENQNADTQSEEPLLPPNQPHLHELAGVVEAGVDTEPTPVGNQGVHTNLGRWFGWKLVVS